jgi:hypothetical protein
VLLGEDRADEPDDAGAVREDPHYAIAHWIEHTYNRRRRQRGLGRLTPVEFELAITDNAAQVAARTTQPLSIRSTAIPNTSQGVAVLRS